MRFGQFDDAAREYVISQPDTPLPWLNYLGGEDYVALITNTAGGYSFMRDARLRRITRYRYNGVPTDAGGRYLYVRDNENGAFWSPTWQPTRTPLSVYHCRHGLGYTVIAGMHAGIGVETTYLVPLGESLELWRAMIVNARPKPVSLSLFSAVEFCLWDAWEDATNFQRNLSVGEVEVVDGVIFHKSEYRERRDHFAYFACSEPLAGFDTQREAFLGPYRGWDRPLAVEQGYSRDSVAHGWAPCGSHHVQLELGPGERQEVVFVLGYAENPRDEKFDPPGSQTIDKRRVQPLLDRYRDPAAVDVELARLRKHWDGLLGRLHVETPNPHVNRMVNVWTPYQTMATFNLSRSASLFESGIGRGMGFRDSNQDLLGFVHLVPERARERILDLAATQLETGGAYHQYQPLTKRGNDAIGSGFNDDPLWLVLAVCAYVRETGDGAILEEPVPYDNRAGTETPLLEHLGRAIHYTLERLGPHGLPLIGRADWNDCLNLNCFSETPGESFQTTGLRDGAVAESVFIAGLFALAAAELADLTGDEELRAARARMVDAVESFGWDGEWFRRAYDAAGLPVGSAECDEGQIFVEPQGICTMAGIGVADGRAARALASVRERLETPHGIVLLQPAYTRYRPELGEITSYPPGYKENAGVFCHTNPWIAIAHAVVGDGDAALDTYLLTNPSAREEISGLHRCEPYVYAQMIAGRDAPTHGEAKNSWLTGAAAWNLVAITQWILGIRAEHGGLRIAPCIPDDWEGFNAVRTFRGATYRIEVRRGEASLAVDGVPIDGDVVPPYPAGRDVAVEVRVPRDRGTDRSPQGQLAYGGGPTCSERA